MITFGTDKQTILDLNIFSRTKEDLSVFDYYNLTKTKGGRDELENMMRTPINDLKEINARISSIKFIHDNNLNCELDNEYLDFIEYYLNQNTPILRDNYIDSLSSWLSYKIKPRNEYYIITRGLDYLKNHLNLLSDFIEKIDKPRIPFFFKQLINEVENIKESPDFKFFIKPKKTKFTFRQLSRYDFLIRKHKKGKIKKILRLTYILDSYFSVASISKDRKLGFPILTAVSYNSN